ncbi:sulfonate ABC transporter ATP-binding protein [Agrobacterium rubi]|uniref:ABC transporter ATP-binding protein n=1 Tax=Agrobacterium rubi TaxID=28099 RepID=UPI00201B8BB6|nr:ABC transporter ATP-binding protein [Agrobacterium rubi]MCL6654895.1 sulfonate ABC transporter ATP-binding protein [Agrobacterium rubi]
MSNTAHLTIENATRQFSVDSKTITALQEVSLSVAEGEFVTIVGASGCGKSTLLRLGAGLDTGHQGEIRHRGDVVKGPSLDRGIVFQEPRLFPWLTVERNIALGLENADVSKAEKKRLVDDHLELVGLTGFAKAYPHQLSGGMAQRAGIARGLVNRPDVLFLDEPFGALDAITKAHLQTELQSIWSQEKITMILVTHDVDEAVFLGDRVVVMSPRPGRIREIVPVNLPRPRDRTSAAFSEVRAHVLQSLNGITPLRELIPGASEQRSAHAKPNLAIASVG